MAFKLVENNLSPMQAEQVAGQRKAGFLQEIRMKPEPQLLAPTIQYSMQSVPPMWMSQLMRS